MKRILSFSFAFFLFLGLFSFNPREVLAADVTQPMKDAAYNLAGSNHFLISYVSGSARYNLILNPGTIPSGIDYVTGSSIYVWDGTTWASFNPPASTYLSDIIFSTKDITSSDGTIVFFSPPVPPIPKALKTLLPALMAQTMKILPVAIAILAALMGVSLISRVLYRYL